MSADERRVEEIRRYYADDLAALTKNPRLTEKEWSDYPETWQEVAMLRDLLAHIDALTARLAAAERDLKRANEANANLAIQVLGKQRDLEAVRNDLADALEMVNKIASAIEEAQKGKR